MMCRKSFINIPFNLPSYFPSLYLNREQTYTQLKIAVNEMEAKFEGLKRNTEEKRQFIEKLKIEHKALVSSST